MVNAEPAFSSQRYFAFVATAARKALDFVALVLVSGVSCAADFGIFPLWD